MIVVLIMLPLLWMWLIGYKTSFKEKLVVGSSFYWLLIVPIIWGLNRFGNILVGPDLFWFLASLISLVLFLFKIIRDGFTWKIYLPKLKLDWPLIIVLSCFALMHIVFYYFYQSMPESDGYINIIRIKEMVETGVINYQYRPLFYVAMTLLGQVTRVDLYQIHTLWMIAVSSLYIVLLSLIIERNNIKKFDAKLLILFSALAVPVINMEIDFFRPQSMFLILFPMIYYLEQKGNNFLALLISLVSLGYHQFFIFPVIIMCFKIFFRLNRFIRVSVAMLGLAIFTYFYSSVVEYLPFDRIFDNIGEVDKWRWWFLESYMTVPDNIEMGWPGFKGAMMYYGYYFGPLVLTGLFLMLFNFKKLSSQKYWLLLIGILLFVSEILPRLNVVYLPERFPVLISLVVIVLLPFWTKRYLNFKYYWVLLICIGIIGSGYIAWSRGSLTNRLEIAAAEWINSNTDEDSIIFSQRSNEIMVKYFSERNYVNPGESFFNDDLLSTYYADVRQKNPVTTKLSSCDDCYLLYSYQKFGGVRDSREYWNKCNYYGADLRKFDINYERVYDKDGVIVWRISKLD